MFAAICNFVKQTTNGGTIQPSIAVFRPRQYGKHDFRIWNKFMIAYAGYQIEEKTSTSGVQEKKIIKIGDQGNLEFTQVIVPYLN
jgi:nitric-oxide synthase